MTGETHAAVSVKHQETQRRGLMNKNQLEADWLKVLMRWTKVELVQAVPSMFVCTSWCSVQHHITPRTETFSMPLKPQSEGFITLNISARRERGEDSFPDSLQVKQLKRIIKNYMNIRQQEASVFDGWRSVQTAGGWAECGFRQDAGRMRTRKTGLHTYIFGPGAVLRGPARAWKKSGGLVKTSSSSSSKSARVFNRSGGRRGELLLSW